MLYCIQHPQNGAIVPTGLAPFLAEVPASAISVGERGMVAPRLRGTDLFLRLMGTSLRFANERRIQLCFGDCEPHRLLKER